MYYAQFPLKSTETTTSQKILFFCISAFSIPCIGGVWWKTSTTQIWWESVHGGPKYGRPHEYLISPIEISVSWPGSKQLWTRPIDTDFNGANYVFMWPYMYLGAPWTSSCQIWCVRVFHHVVLKYGNENAEMKKKWWRHSSVLYWRIRVKEVVNEMKTRRDAALNGSAVALATGKNEKEYSWHVPAIKFIGMKQLV